MFFEVTAIARDVAIILLAFLSLVMGVLPFYLLLKITQGLRRLIPKVAPGLRRAQGGLQVASGYVDRAMAGARAPFLWSAQMGTRLRALPKPLHKTMGEGGDA